MFIRIKFKQHLNWSLPKQIVKPEEQKKKKLEAVRLS